MKGNYILASRNTFWYSGIPYRASALRLSDAVGLLLIIGGLSLMNIDALPVWLQVVGVIASVIGAFVIVSGRLTEYINAHFRAWNVKYIISPVPYLTTKRQTSWRYRTNSLGKHVLCLRVNPCTGTSFDEIEIRFTNRRRFRRWKWEEASPDKVEVLWIASVDYYHKSENIPFSLERQRSDTVGGQRANYRNYDRSKDDYIWIYVIVNLKQEWGGRLHFRSSLYGGNRYARQSFAVILSKSSFIGRVWDWLAYGPGYASVHPTKWLNACDEFQIVKEAATKEI